jgi:hypothetical protein
MRTGQFGNDRGMDRVGFFSAPRLSQRCDMVDVYTQSRHGKSFLTIIYEIAFKLINVGVQNIEPLQLQNIFTFSANQ